MKYLSMVFIALGLFVSGVALADNPTESVIIHYSGTVTIPPCTITTQSIGIDFGDIEANTLAESSSATDWKDVAVLLTNCTDVTTATMTVSNTPSAANPQYIASTGTAEHVGIEAQAFYYSNIPLSNGLYFNLVLMVQAVTLSTYTPGCITTAQVRQPLALLSPPLHCLLNLNNQLQMI